MNKQKKNRRPVLSSQQGDLEPYDYARIQKLKDKAGVSLELDWPPYLATSMLLI